MSFSAKVYRISSNTRATRTPSKRHVVLAPVRASGSPDDTPGVTSLLKRDYKEIKISDSAFVCSQKRKSDDIRKQSTGASSAPVTTELSKVRKPPAPQMKCKDAIQQGLDLFAQEKYSEAVEAFRLSLELPGSGVMREAGSPREFACASQGEENAALYNMACCYCKLGQGSAAYTCIEALLENGFEDVHALKSDQDLALIQGPQLNELLAKHNDFLKQLFKQRSSSNKPWLQW